MRRRVKRRLFLMSMALATGASGHAFAQGGKSIPGQGHDFSGDYPAASLPLADGDGLGQGANSSTLLGQVKTLLGELGFGTETVKPAAVELRAEGARIGFTFPPASVSLLSVKVE